MELGAWDGTGALDGGDPAALPAAPPLHASPRGGAAPHLLDVDRPFVDWLLEEDSGPHEWECAPSHVPRTAAAPLEAAVPPAPAAGGMQWRCLESTHAASCSRCKPAPAPDEAQRYHLVDTRGVLTEKRLRTLLARCAEWNDVAACARLAAAVEAEEAASGTLSGVVELLRTHNWLANMRKLSMLRLAHQWGYRSDCWQQRPAGTPTTKRRRSPAPNRPEYDAAAAAARCRSEAEALCVRPFTALQVAQGQVSRWTSGMCEMRLQTLRSWRDSLSTESLRAPAYLMDGAYNSPSSELEAIKFIVTTSAAATHDTITRLLQADGRLRPQDAAWIADYDAGHHCIMVMLASVNAHVTMQRQQPLSTYLEAADAALVGLCDYARKTTAALVRRVEWTAAMAESQGPAAGNRLQAKAMILPVEQRLILRGRQGLLALATSVTPLGQPPTAFSLCAQRPAAGGAT